MRQEFFAKNSQISSQNGKKMTEIMKKKWRWDKNYFSS
jgi:hypothetical protein